MQVLYFDLNAARREKFLQKFPHAKVTGNAQDAVYYLSYGHYDIIGLNLYKSTDPTTYEDIHHAEPILNFIMTYFPAIKRIWLNGDDFEEVARYRQGLQACGYIALFMPFDNMLTFTGP